MNKDVYLYKTEEMLGDPETYTQLQKDPTTFNNIQKLYNELIILSDIGLQWNY